MSARPLTRAERWSDELAAGPFVQTPLAVWEILAELGLGPHELVTVLVLDLHRVDADVVRVPEDRLRNLTRLSAGQQKRALRALDQGAGLISRHRPRRVDGTADLTEYDLGPLRRRVRKVAAARPDHRPLVTDGPPATGDHHRPLVTQPPVAGDPDHRPPATGLTDNGVDNDVDRARARPTGRRQSRKVDQSQPPADLPPELVERLPAVLDVLTSIWDVRGGVTPQERGVGLGMLRNPGVDHLAVARKLNHWLTAGKGQSAKCADIAARFGDWVADEVAGAAPRAGGARSGPGGRESPSDLILAINAANPDDSPAVLRAITGGAQ